MGGGPTTVYWRGVYVDPTTAKMLDEAARIVGDDIYLRPIQGSYNTSTEASGGTHDGGGVVDIGCSNLTDDQAKRVETALRKVGCAAWWRPKTSYWSSHVHAVRQDCGDASWQAKTQVGDYRAGYNGIPIGGRINKDTGTRAYVDVTWGTYKAEGLTMSEYTNIMESLDDLRTRINSVGTKTSNVDEETLGKRLPGADNARLDEVVVGTWLGVRALGAKQDAFALALSKVLTEVLELPAETGAVLEQKLKDAVVSVNVNFPAGS